LEQLPIPKFIIYLSKMNTQAEILIYTL